MLLTGVEVAAFVHLLMYIVGQKVWLEEPPFSEPLEAWCN